jgi:hypothetical protein
MHSRDYVWLLLATAAPVIFGQFGFDFTDIIDAFDSFIEGQIVALLDGLIYVFELELAIGDVLAAGIDFTYFTAGDIFLDVIDFFKWIYANIIKVAVLWLIDQLEALRQWLYDHFKPLIDFLHRLLLLQQQFFKTYLRPILNLIINLRRFAQLLRIFHLHFLDKLDAKLGGLEARILGNFGITRQWINRLLTYIELILTADGFLRRTLFMSSLGYSANDVLLLGTGRGLDYWSSSDTQQQGGPVLPQTLADVSDEIQASNAASSGFWYDLAQGAADNWADLG